MISFFAFGLGLSAEAQVSVGLYQGGVFSYLGVGTNPEKKYFAEARLFAGDVLNNYFGAEVIGQRNFKQTDWYNFSAGLLLGYHEFDFTRIGIPVFFTIKPIQSNKNFAVILETTPYVAFSSTSGNFHFRGNLGIRYFIQKRE